MSAHCKNRNLAKKFDLIKIAITANRNKRERERERERTGVNYHYMAQTNNQGVANKTLINTIDHWWGFFLGLTHIAIQLVLGQLQDPFTPLGLI